MASRRRLFTDEMLKDIDRDSVINGDDSDSESSLLDISRQTCSQDGSVNTLGFLQASSTRRAELNPSELPARSFSPILPETSPTDLSAGNTSLVSYLLFLIQLMSLI